MFDGRFFLGFLASLLVHALLVASLWYLGSQRIVAVPLGGVYNVEIVPVKLRSKPVRKKAKAVSKPVKKPLKKSVSAGKVVKPKKAVSKRKPPEKKVLYSKKKKKALSKKPKGRKPKKKVAKKKVVKKTVKTVSEQELLKKKIEELRAERQLLEKIESLRRQKQLSQKATSGVGVSSKKGLSEVSVSHASSTLDPLMVLYLNRLVARIQMNWSLPEGITGKEAVVDVKIDRKGRLVELHIEKSSGNELFDGSCIRAVRRAFPFDPLPPVYEGLYFEVGVRFKR